MKKTACIRLVLITAALAGCDRPLYQQGPDYPGASDPGGYSSGSYDPYSSNSYNPPTGEQPDSGNSCPLVQSQLPPDYYIWYSGLQPWDFYYGDGFSLDGYYAYRYPATIVRAGFGKSAYARVGGGAHS